MESTYLNALRMIQTQGQHKTDRTGVGTISYFGIDMRFDLSQSFITNNQILPFQKYCL